MSSLETRNYWQWFGRSVCLYQSWGKGLCESIVLARSKTNSAAGQKRKWIWREIKPNISRLREGVYSLPSYKAPKKLLSQHQVYLVSNVLICAMYDDSLISDTHQTDNGVNLSDLYWDWKEKVYFADRKGIETHFPL